jgi:hypothetical protein
MRPFWQVLYRAKAELVLNGHNHQYERFAKQRPDGTYDPANGVREVVVGTGGAGLYSFGTPRSNSQVRNAKNVGCFEALPRRRPPKVLGPVSRQGGANVQ